MLQRILFPSTVRSFATKAATAYNPVIEPTKPVLVGKYPKYAGALYKFASDEGIVEEVGVNLDAMAYALADNQWNEIVEGLKDSSKAGQAAALEEFFDTFAFEDMTRDIIRELFETDELKAVRHISETYETIFRYKHKVFDAVITSAAPLKEDQVNRIKSRIVTMCPEGSTINYFINVDSALIGGFTINIEDVFMDLSVQKQVSTLIEHVRETGFPEVEMTAEDAQKIADGATA
jgi:F-type H+-transporting ATPase subunit delta